MYPLSLQAIHKLHSVPALTVTLYLLVFNLNSIAQKDLIPTSLPNSNNCSKKIKLFHILSQTNRICLPTLQALLMTPIKFKLAASYECPSVLIYYTHSTQSTASF